jgi:Glycine zipper
MSEDRPLSYWRGGGDGRPPHSIFTYTQRDVANVAVSVSSTAAVGATVGTFVAPGPGSVVGGLVGGLVGLVIERVIDRKSTEPSER